MLLNIKVIPKSSLNQVIKQTDGSYKIKITTAPEQGRANKKVIALLAKELKVSKSSLEIVQGLTSRNKLVKINNN
ncbi:MAG TPA: DUF167 domain-containing protein [bacterium]|nr:DUF167 domain-containing protein [bacterium]HPL95183.1 DUF167 domain-containing protein [bacterium]